MNTMKFSLKREVKKNWFNDFYEFNVIGMQTNLNAWYFKGFENLFEDFFQKKLGKNFYLVDLK